MDGGCIIGVGQVIPNHPSLRILVVNSQISNIILRSLTPPLDPYGTLDTISCDGGEGGWCQGRWGVGAFRLLVYAI